MPGREPDIEKDLDCPEYQNALSTAAHHWFSDIYETQQEQEMDEIEFDDLIDCWDAWGFEGVGGLITEEINSRPASAASLDFPGTSYSDTTSEEDSIRSHHNSSFQADSAAEPGFVPYCLDENEFEDFEQTSARVLYEDDVGKPRHTVSSKLGGVETSKEVLLSHTALTMWNIS
jgi:hypothetical protein